MTIKASKSLITVGNAWINLEDVNDFVSTSVLEFLASCVAVRDLFTLSDRCY